MPHWKPPLPCKNEVKQFVKISAHVTQLEFNTISPLKTLGIGLLKHPTLQVVCDLKKKKFCLSVEHTFCIH